MLRRILLFITTLALCAGSFATDECKTFAEHWTVSEPLSIDDVEREALERVRDRPSLPQVPFAYGNDDWVRFKSQFTEEDVLVHAKMGAPPGLPHGYSGYARMRNGCVQDFFLVTT